MGISFLFQVLDLDENLKNFRDFNFIELFTATLGGHTDGVLQQPGGGG